MEVTFGLGGGGGGRSKVPGQGCARHGRGGGLMTGGFGLSSSSLALGLKPGVRYGSVKGVGVAVGAGENLLSRSLPASGSAATAERRDREATRVVPTEVKYMIELFPSGFVLVIFSSLVSGY